MSMFYLNDKLQSRIKEIKNYRLIDKKELNNWKMIPDSSKQEKYPPVSFEGANEFMLGEWWEGRDSYLWIHHNVVVPDRENNFFYFDFGRTGGGYNSGFESFMFIDGKPYQGVDSNHKEVRIADEYRGKEIQVTLKLWSGLEGGGKEAIQRHQFKDAQLCQLEKDVDDLYYFSDMLYKTIVAIDKNDPIQYKLSNILDKSLRMIEWALPASKEFFQSITNADNFLNIEIEKLPKNSLVTVTAVGHTHIDVAWLWRLKHTREKAARSFSTVLRLMEEYPEYTFLQTQPQLYKYIKEDYPEIYEQIKQRIKEGRWEADGSMWLEADCNIPSGESLTRQILHGSQFFKKEFDKEVNYLWLPDVFGYSWALPQILKKSGIDTFMTTKISWNQYNRMPHDTFIWKGIDGSEVLTHFITTPEPEEENGWESNWYYTYNGELEPETVKGVYDNYRDKNINDELLISYGFGDGGGGVNRKMLENRRKIDKIPGLPNLKTGSAKEYFNKLQKTFKNTDEYVHVWDGELYLEYHRGTYTSQAYVKKSNRKSELLLRKLEIIYSMLEMNDSITYPKEKFYDMWEIVLRNQFHDIIPGSSIREVYEDHAEEMNVLFKDGNNLIQEITKKEDSQVILNLTGWNRTAIAKLEKITENLAYFDRRGKELASYTDKENTYVLIEDIAPFDTEKITSGKRINRIEEVITDKTTSNSVETEFYNIKWETSGQLISIFDKKIKREVLNGKGNVFQLFEDKPMNFDAWDIDIFYQEKFKELIADKITVKKSNQLLISILFEYHFGKSTILQEMKVYHHNGRIDFITKVNWQERQQLLKVMFDVDIRTNEARYDVQYGNVTRSNNWNTSWDYAKFESVAHQWADLSQRNYGVSLLNDSKYGYDIKDTVIRLSLLKGAIYPDPTADLGEHEFIYSLLPHKGDFIEGQTVEQAWDINDPLMVLSGLDTNLPKIKINSANSIMIDAIKKAEDGNGWIIRLHEFGGGNQQVNLTIDVMNWWNETNLMEKNSSDKRTTPIKLVLTPYEIKTIRIGR